MIVIPDIFEGIVNGLTVSGIDNIYFKYGDPIEINNQNDNNNIIRAENYPAIFLFLELDEIRDSSSYWAKINPRLAIVNTTKADYIASQRLDNNFRTVLYPIYEALMDAIKSSSYVGNYNIEHIKRDKYFYGRSKSEFNDNLDAITIDLKNLIINKIC